MHIRLTQPGYENFTGLLGAISFTDGLSDYGVSEQQAGGILIVVTGELVDVTAGADNQPVETPEVEPGAETPVGNPEAEPEPESEPEAEPEAPTE